MLNTNTFENALRWTMVDACTNEHKRWTVTYLMLLLDSLVPPLEGTPQLPGLQGVQRFLVRHLTISNDAIDGSQHH